MRGAWRVYLFGVIAAAAALAPGVVGPRALRAGPDDDVVAATGDLAVANRDELTEESVAAVREALKFLASRQNADGSWSNVVGFKLNLSYRPVESSTPRPHVGVTALAAMSFMAGGSLPGRGPYGQQVGKALEFILTCVEDNGYVKRGNSRMYSHAFATLFLAEVYGATQREDVRQKLQLAAQFIVDAQNAEGAWRYAPHDRESDMSITVCQIMALRAVQNAGLRVPDDVRKKAVAYVERAYDDAGADGPFRYQDTPGSRSSYALTAAGVTALHGTGDYNSPKVRHGLTWLTDPSNAPLTLREIHPGARFDLRYFYGYYYAAQAAFHSGDSALWKRWIADTRRRFLRCRQPDGSWLDDVGANYATAMAALILQLPNRLLPIFQG
ncbi:MAG: terpene cyclase/mutase family protein [Planctomycetes bacterium]|nr:terpene cyclase/mutase family protein [Planctomycetota bacterium]